MAAQRGLMAKASAMKADFIERGGLYKVKYTHYKNRGPQVFRDKRRMQIGFPQTVHRSTLATIAGDRIVLIGECNPWGTRGAITSARRDGPCMVGGRKHQSKNSGISG